MFNWRENVTANWIGFNQFFFGSVSSWKTRPLQRKAFSRILRCILGISMAQKCRNWLDLKTKQREFFTCSRCLFIFFCHGPLYCECCLCGFTCPFHIYRAFRMFFFTINSKTNERIECDHTSIKEPTILVNIEYVCAFLVCDSLEVSFDHFIITTNR